MRDKIEMTEDGHKARHLMLHRYLDELVADFIDKTHRLPSSTTVLELLQWSHGQTTNPSTERELPFDGQSFGGEK